MHPGREMLYSQTQKMTEESREGRSLIGGAGAEHHTPGEALMPKAAVVAGAGVKAVVRAEVKVVARAEVGAEARAKVKAVVAVGAEVKAPAAVAAEVKAPVAVAAEVKAVVEVEARVEEEVGALVVREVGVEVI